MEEVEQLVKAISGLPHLALWVIAIFYAYKVIVVGSIYGVIRFVSTQLFDWLKNRHETVELRGLIDGMCITDASQGLIAQLERLKGIGSNGNIYIHKEDVLWLRDAIDAKMAAAAAVKAQKQHA